MAGIFPAISSAATLSVEQVNTNYYWSIDNSKFGGLKEQSRIEWEASPLLLKLSEQFAIGSVGVFAGADTNAKFTDNDWCRSADGSHCSNRNPAFGGNKILNYSSDTAKATMYRVGLFYAGDVYRFGNVLGLDSLSIENTSSLFGDFYKAKGLYSERYGRQKFSAGVTSNRTEKYVFDSEYGLRAVKSLNGFVFSITPYIALHNMYMIDHHVLRHDFKNMRFTLLDTALRYGARMAISHEFHGVNLSAGASYGTYKGLIAKSLIWKGDGRKSVGVGAGERGGDESSFFISANYKF